MKQEICYDNRIVAFLDILGFRHLILQHADNAGWASDIFRKVQKAEYQLANQRHFVQISHFSDCICLSVPSSNESFLYLSSVISGIATHFLHMGYPLRGGITEGLLYHSDGIVVGPALVKAYELENEIALYPRIIFNPEMPISQITDWVIVDDDEVKYLDVLCPDLLYLYKTCVNQHFEFDLSRIYKMIKDRSKDSGSSAYAKYEWLFRYIGRDRPATIRGEPHRFK